MRIEEIIIDGFKSYPIEIHKEENVRVDMVACVKDVKVFLNNEELKLKNFKEYMRLYLSERDDMNHDETLDLSAVEWELLDLSDAEWDAFDLSAAARVAFDLAEGAFDLSAAEWDAFDLSVAEKEGAFDLSAAEWDAFDLSVAE
ncbi:hypothetical protein C1645_882554 [Glomus cerebriforme]|uniref:Uncharacterized protein n=1 Tax=Glomus cerebriforme TaxID=658196 RepID=A0A397S6S7_9GLOM|nr:hypothetical protein C1645_882554 [Glomus cerebriforme]